MYTNWIAYEGYDYNIASVVKIIEQTYSYPQNSSQKRALKDAVLLLKYCCGMISVGKLHGFRNLAEDEEQ